MNASRVLSDVYFVLYVICCALIVMSVHLSRGGIALDWQLILLIPAAFAAYGYSYKRTPK